MLKRIAPDKWKHFFVGILMGAVLECFFVLLLQLPLSYGTICAVGISIAISYGFELISLYTGRGHYEFLDALASIVGAAVGIWVAFLFI